MENQRVRLSKKLLKNALIELLRKKSLDKITIYELCDTAEINRTTFYKYYGSQKDLLDDIVNELFGTLENCLDVIPNKEIESVKQLFDYIKSDSLKWKVIINAVDDQEFTKRLFQLPAIHNLVARRMKKEHTKREEEYLRLFFCQGGYAIIRKWLNEDNPETPESIADLLASLSYMMP